MNSFLGHVDGSPFSGVANDQQCPYGSLIWQYLSPLNKNDLKKDFILLSKMIYESEIFNDFLERKGSKIIEDISFMHQEQNPRNLGDKKSILDINCKDKAGHHFIIKIQREKEYFFDMRALYYAANLLSRQLKETEPYNKLKPVIVIGIVDFVLYKTSHEAISHHMICDMSTGQQSIDLIELHFIELAKFHKKVDELVSHIDKWIFFLKNAQQLEEIPKNYKNNPQCQ